MAITQEQLAQYIGVEATDPDYSVVEDCLGSATTVLDDVLSEAYREPPTDLVDQWTKEVGMEFWKRRDSVSGSSQYADYDTGAPVRGPRDPLTRVWPSIRRYVVPF